MFLCSFLFGQEYQINMTNSEDTKIAQIWKISSFMKIYACNGDGHMNPFVSLTSLELLCVLRPVLESQLLRLRPTHCRGVHSWATAPMGVSRGCCSHKLGKSFTSRLVNVISSESVC